jgi:hypothetical protein
MTISQEVDALQAKIAQLKNSVQACQHEIAKEDRARQAEATADSGHAPQAASCQAHQAEQASTAQTMRNRKSFKAAMAVKMHELQQRIDRKRTSDDAKEAEEGAEWAESYAMDALMFAGWAIGEAETAVLEAADARATANARARR